MRWYRLLRARQIASQPRRVTEGFSFASYDAAFSDEWERAERSVANRLFPEYDAMVDVGANNGFYSLLANHLGISALAIELDIRNLIILRKNVAKTKIEVVPVALSDVESHATLYGDGDMAPFDPDWQNAGEGFSQTVKTATLDKLLDGKWVGKKLFVKIDVEGAEDLVLRGASDTIARSPRPYWLIETGEIRPSGQPNCAYETVFRIMEQAGYSAEHIAHGNFLFS